MNQMIYMAYGSNLNKEQMSIRCPDAEVMGRFLMPDHRLVFKGVADMIPAVGHECPVALWRITDACEEALDIYEGFPKLYRKEYWTHEDGKMFMAYVMNRDGLAPPPPHYLDCIRDGYQDFGLDAAYLNEAVKLSMEYQSDEGHIPKKYRNG